MEKGLMHFQNIRITMPLKSVYARLGFRRDRTEIKPSERESVNMMIDEAGDVVHLKGCARIMGIVRMDKDSIELENGTIFSSSLLARMLTGCTHALLMGATAGQGIMDAINQAAETDNLSRAVVLDAVASEMTDAALDWIMGYTNLDLMRNSAYLTKKRFSAGYGDFPLENQKAMYDLLRMDAIGVSITDTCILIPEKSVTAIAGIEDMGHKI